MSVLFFFISILLGFAFILGLVKPSIVIRWKANPTRKDASKIYISASIFFLILSMFTHTDQLEEALKDPLNTTEIAVRNKDLTALPTDLLKLENLTSLDLSKNNFTSIPEGLKALKKLQSLDLSNNPISNIPDWIYGMESLTHLILDGSNLQSISNIESSKELTFSYKSTPLWNNEHPTESDDNISNNEEITSSDNSDDRTESFGEYAFRSILGQDYGQKRKFGNSEIFYDHPVTKEEADAVGEAMQLIGVFTEESAASVLLDKEFDDNDSAVYIMKIVITDIDDVNDEMLVGFNSIREMVALSALNNQTLHLHLTNGEFETQKVLK